MNKLKLATLAVLGVLVLIAVVQVTLGFLVGTAPPEPGTAEEAVFVCTGARMKAADFGLVSKASQSDVSVATQLKAQYNKIRESDSPEATKQQFQFLACIDKRFAEAAAQRAATGKSADTCTTAAPCVSLVRIADFRQSGCVPAAFPAASATEPGRRDVAIFEDTISLEPKLGVPTYVASAQPNGGATVKVLSKGGIAIPPVATPTATNPAYSSLDFNIPVEDGVVRFTWQWTNGHWENQEGLVVRNLYQLRNFHAQLLLPPGMTLEFIPVEPASVSSKCVVGYNNVACTGLTGPESRAMVKWFWNWNMWKDCPRQTAQPSTAAPPALPLATAGAASQVLSAASAALLPTPPEAGATAYGTAR